MMNSRSKMGIIIALVFTAAAFILALYNIFSVNSGAAHSTGAWFTGLFTLLATVFSISLLSARSSSPLVLDILCTIIAGVFAIFMGFYWMLLCLIISLVGCIMYRASRTGAKDLS